MTETLETELDERIARIVGSLLRAERADEWMDAQRAADHLKMSRHHFLRLCRNDEGPEGHGDVPRPMEGDPLPSVGRRNSACAGENAGKQDRGLVFSLSGLGARTVEEIFR